MILESDTAPCVEIYGVMRERVQSTDFTKENELTTI